MLQDIVPPRKIIKYMFFYKYFANDFLNADCAI